VAEQLNNTRAVCRKYYVHPAVFETYTAGSLQHSLGNGNGAGRKGLTEEEQALVRLLRKTG
jgi:DNA topoisomerase-1